MELTNEAKNAILNIFANAAWSVPNGQQYYDALADAFFGVASISAVYTQSGDVYDTDTLDDLKADLVVTATLKDSSTETVPSTDYTLSGTLAVGTSTITVSYGGKTTTFNVTVTRGWDFEWTATSQTLATGMTAKSYSFEGDAMYANQLNLDLEHIGDAEIELECKWYSDINIPNNPAVAIKHGEKAGTKIYPSNGNVMTNISGSNVSTGISYADYHVINLKGVSGNYTLKVDQTVFTGTGVTNNNYLYNVGIHSESASSIFGIYVKYIKFRVL